MSCYDSLPSGLKDPYVLSINYMPYIFRGASTLLKNHYLKEFFKSEILSTHKGKNCSAPSREINLVIFF